ncbi:MAG: AzlD domain-containing protein [Betaproteobacteria bacterium]|nr:AzlD domain-containing protein [Betaproteobacteria bacterium]MBK9609722.1 AzlD domain-containing protein [Betaproteobacteria bacterium]
MSERPDYLFLLCALAATSYACRAGGFWLMRFVTVTPRLEAALRAAPLSVMIGVVAPAAVRGSIPELAGLATIVALMRWRPNDLVATMAGVAVVAGLRAFLR